MPNKNKSTHYPWLDLIRGVAALLVCIGHARNALWVDYADNYSKTWLNTLTYFITGLGHQAVIVFFVLSGFLVGGSILAAGSKFQWGNYIQSRLVRLWLVLLPALLFTVFCDFFTLRFSQNAFDGTFAHIWNSGPISEEGLSWRVFIANIFFLQTIHFPVFGSNVPLWSLANEFWYYIIFPLILCAFDVAGSYRVWQRLLMGLFAVGILIWLPWDMVLYFLAWLAGVVCALVNRRFPAKIASAIVMISAISFGLTVLYSKYPDWRDVLYLGPDVYICLSFSIFLACVNTYTAPWIEDGVLGHLIIRFSDFSYSLYLLHFPLIILFFVSLLAPSQLQPDFFAYFVLLALTSLCVATAWLNWWIFERHNRVIRVWVGLFRRYIIATLSRTSFRRDAH